jgi:hypothetical protein
VLLWNHSLEGAEQGAASGHDEKSEERSLIIRREEWRILKEKREIRVVVERWKEGARRVEQ